MGKVLPFIMGEGDHHRRSERITDHQLPVYLRGNRKFFDYLSRLGNGTQICFCSVFALFVIAQGAIVFRFMYNIFSDLLLCFGVDLVIKTVSLSSDLESNVQTLVDSTTHGPY